MCLVDGLRIFKSTTSQRSCAVNIYPKSCSLVHFNSCFVLPPDLLASKSLSQRTLCIRATDTLTAPPCPSKNSPHGSILPASRLDSSTCSTCCSDGLTYSLPPARRSPGISSYWQTWRTATSSPWSRRRSSTPRPQTTSSASRYDGCSGTQGSQKFTGKLFHIKSPTV